MGLWGHLAAFAEKECKVAKSLHIVILGDSNTSIGGDACDLPQGWSYWFAQALSPLSCRSYARSGATWSHTPRSKRNTKENTARLGDDNILYNQICRLLEAHREKRQPTPDVIILAAGTNDTWFSDRRPNAFKETAEEALAIPKDELLARPLNEILSLAGAIRYGCLLLREAFPHAKIIMLTPLQTTVVADDLIARTGTLIEAVSQHLELPVIRQDLVSPLSSQEEARRHKYTYDGTHTNRLGAKTNGLLLADLICCLLST